MPRQLREGTSTAGSIIRAALSQQILPIVYIRELRSQFSASVRPGRLPVPRSTTTPIRNGAGRGKSPRKIERYSRRHGTRPNPQRYQNIDEWGQVARTCGRRSSKMLIACRSGINPGTARTEL